jgi:hypothetical protein
MNERIQQLAKQAGFVFWKDESWNPGDVIDWSCRYDDEFKEFAELIVRECANYAFSDDRQKHIAMLKHFGVEE